MVFDLPSACIHSSCAWTRYFHSSNHTPTQTNHGWEVFWESTPQPVPKHTPTVTKAHPESVLWCLLGRALVFVGMCFPECALVVPECALASTGVCFAKGWGPKKIQNESKKYSKTRSQKNKKLFKKCQKSIGFTAFKPLHFEAPQNHQKSRRNHTKMAPNSSTWKC